MTGSENYPDEDRKEPTMTTALTTKERRVVPKQKIRTASKDYQLGVHVHLFGISKNGEVISALILRRASNKKYGIISGKSEPGETSLTTAYRETHEEIGQIPLAIFDTGKRLSIQCRNYELRVSVFAGLIPHNSLVVLNHESLEFAFVPTVFSPCHIEIPEQRHNQIFCINRAREMYQAMMN